MNYRTKIAKRLRDGARHFRGREEARRFIIDLEAAADLLEYEAAVSIAYAKPVAWRWLYKGKPELYALGGSLCFDGTGPDDAIEARVAAAEHPRTVQKLYLLPLED